MGEEAALPVSWGEEHSQSWSTSAKGTPVLVFFLARSMSSGINLDHNKSHAASPPLQMKTTGSLGNSFAGQIEKERSTTGNLP